MCSAGTRRGAADVSVPVLSNMTVSISARRSIEEPSLTRMPFLNNCCAAITCTIGTASPSAQGHVMIRTAMAMVMALCRSPVAIIQPVNVRNAVCMHDWRVERRCAVSDTPVAGSALLGRFHHPDHFGEERIAGLRRCDKRQRTGEVQRARAHCRSRRRTQRHAFTGDQRDVELGITLADGRIDGHTFAGAKHDRSCRARSLRREDRPACHPSAPRKRLVPRAGPGL